jgi:hypothetical protein
VRLKQKCVNSLGEELFQQAYQYLKQQALDHQQREEERQAEEGEELIQRVPTEEDLIASVEEKNKQIKIMEILGSQRAHYLPLLDQLIFMEDTHLQNTRKK